MKNFFFILFIFFSVCVNAQIEKAIPSKPSRTEGLVHDFTKARLITAQQEEFLEQKLQKYNDSTSNQIAIVIVEGLKGYDANEFSRAIGETWGVGGQANFDNGIVILISTGGGEGKRDAYIATGRGLEGAIPDITAKYIVEEEIIPNFKIKEFFRGFDEATDAIIKAAAGEYKAPAGYGKGKKPKNIIGTIILILIILFVISSRGKKGGGGMMSRRGYHDAWGPIFWGSAGGWSGGGGGGGSSGGGSFGGFGGGSFGGGGAGGSW